MTRFAAPGFTGSPLIRVDHERNNPAWFDEQAAKLSARLMRLDGLIPRAEEDGTLSWGSLAEAPPEVELALLGLIDDKPRFVALTDTREDPSHRSFAVNVVLNQLQPAEAATYAVGRGLVDWHSRHRFCARCGRGTRAHLSGWARLCDREQGGCGTEHFPRTDPVVIMLAEHGDHVLVGRQHSWPARRFSALAGFLEVGESIEEAVARELHEEAGVVTQAVRYICSQPWPFPSQLMIACIASVASKEIVLDGNELEGALWVDRGEVAAALREDADATFLAPPPFAIAHSLLSRWAEGA